MAAWKFDFFASSYRELGAFSMIRSPENRKAVRDEQWKAVPFESLTFPSESRATPRNRQSKKL